MCLEPGVGPAVLRAALGAASVHETGRARAIVTGGCARAIRAALEAYVYTGIQAHMNALYNVPQWVYGVPATGAPATGAPATGAPPVGELSGATKCASSAPKPLDCAPESPEPESELRAGVRKARSAGNVATCLG